MESDRLAVFRAVAREGGFSRAAAKLFRTQPAVSQAVRALEDELGEQLFLREGRRTRLTPAGEIWLAHVDEAFASLERGRAALAARQALESGELTIVASDTTARYVLPPLLALFRERHPGVELRIANRPSHAAAARVAARDADVGFVMLPVEQAGVEQRDLCALEDVAIVSPGHPLAARRRCRLEQLLEHPLLLLDRGAELRRFVDARIAESGATARVAMELGSIEVVKRLVALGLGVSIVPAHAVADEVDRGELCARPIWPRARFRRLAVVWPSRGPVWPAAEAFLEITTERLARARAPRRASRR